MSDTIIGQPKGVRAPRQARGRSSLERVLRAGAQVLAERGYDGFTLAEVGRCAGVSNGTIYWRFHSKEALFTAIHERDVQAIMEEVTELDDDARFIGMQLKQQLHTCLCVLATTLRRRAGLMRTFIARAMFDAPTSELVSRAAARETALFEKRLRTCADEIRRPDPNAAIAITVSVMISSLIHNAEMMVERPPRTDAEWDTVVDELTAVGCAYLGCG